jgi:hypothetical protein
MKPYLHQNSSSKEVTPTINSSNQNHSNLSNAEMIEAMKNGNSNPQLLSNSERIELLDKADLITDIGGIVPNKRVNALNAGINGIKGYEESPCTTTAGKLVDGGLDATFNFLLGSSPVTNVGDIILPEGYKISEMTDSTSSAITSSVESLITWDDTALQNYKDKAESGEYGEAVQNAPSAQQYWEEKGLGGGLTTFGEELIDLTK